MKNIILGITAAICVLSCSKDSVNESVQTSQLDETPYNDLIECVLPVYCGESNKVDMVYQPQINKPTKSKEVTTFVINDLESYKANFYYNDYPMLYTNNISSNKKTSDQLPVNEKDELITIFPIIDEPIICFYPFPDFKTKIVVGVVNSYNSCAGEQIQVTNVEEDDCGVVVYYKKIKHQADYNYYYPVYNNSSFVEIPKTEKTIRFKEIIEQENYAVFGIYNTHLYDGKDVFYKIKNNQLSSIHQDYSPNISDLKFVDSPSQSQITLDFDKIKQYIPKELIGVQYDGYTKAAPKHPVENWFYVEVMIDNEKTSIHLPVDEKYYANKTDFIQLKNYLMQLMMLIN